MDFTLFKRNYYCLISGLPDLLIDSKKVGEGELSLEFKNELFEQLHSNDYDVAKLLYLHYDNKNFQNLLFNQEEEMEPLGNYTSEYLEQQIKEPTSLVGYMQVFLKDVAAEICNQEDVNKLLADYYSHVLKTNNKFLREWFLFDLNLKNILTAANCRKFNYDLNKHLISNDANRLVVTQLLESVPEAASLEELVPYADEILKVAESDLDMTAKEKELDMIKWRFLEEKTLFNYFTIENVLVHIIKLEMVDRWMKIDDETGKQLFSELVQNLKSSYEFSEEFSLTKGRTLES